MADCSNPLNDLIGCTVQGVVGSQMEQFTEQLFKGANDLWTGFFTSWIQSPLDGVIDGAAAEWFAMIAAPVQVLLLSLGLMVAGIRTMLLARGEPAAEAGKKFLRAILITVAGVAFFQVILLGCNALARWILESASDASLLGDATTFAGNTAMALIFGIFAVIVVGIQWLIMILRAVALTALVPFWPVAASGAMFNQHEGMFQKTTGWLLAWALYSPIAAALYGMAMKLRQGVDGVPGLMLGIAIFLLALFALPALMRLVVPISAAVGSASAGAMMAGGMRAAATTAVAVGATVATAGAAAPAVAAGGGAAAAGGGAAAAGSAGSAGTAGSAASKGAGSTGARSTGAGGVSGAGSGAGGASSSAGGAGSGSSRSGWDSARELTNALPRGSQTSVGDTFDE